jgi:Xaa-Pro aminopeptidase
MTAILLYGDTVRYPALRHEVPLAIIDPLLIAVENGSTRVMTSSLETARIADAVPEAEQVLLDDLGFYEMLGDGVDRGEAELEVVLRAVQRWGIERATVPPDLPVAVADKLRGAGIEIDVDAKAVEARRRAKSAAELEGIRRAQRAAERGMDAGRTLIKGATDADGLLQHDGKPLTAEMVRDAIRAECTAAGAPAPPDIMVVSLFAGGGHDPGSGPLPAGKPIEIDLWPRDEASGCWADMTRTFVGAGEVTDEVARLSAIAREALEAARAAARPGVTGRALYDAACDVVEAAGHPTQRTRKPGETLDHGFYFGLGHGVGLEVHEPPGLGLSGHEPLVAGDVVAIEPGIEGIEGIGGVRFEDLLLITEEGSETLTDYPYDL